MAYSVKDFYAGPNEELPLNISRVLRGPAVYQNHFLVMLLSTAVSGCGLDDFERESLQRNAVWGRNEVRQNFELPFAVSIRKFLSAPPPANLNLPVNSVVLLSSISDITLRISVIWCSKAAERVNLSSPSFPHGSDMALISWLVRASCSTLF